MNRRAGFTLIEVLAVVLMTGVLMGVALNFYLDLSRASNRAADNTRGTRRTAAVLDRIVTDLENVAFLHKPDARDAGILDLLRRWRRPQLGPSGSSSSRAGTMRGAAVPESDLAVVTYTLRRSQGRRRRAVARRFGPRTASTVPSRFAAAERLVVLPRGGRLRRRLPRPVRAHAWDSSSLVEETELPAAVEIRLAMTEPSQNPENLVIQHRWVRLPIRPIDLEAMFKAAGDEEGEEQAKTVCDCIDCATLAATPSGAHLVQEIGRKLCGGGEDAPDSIRNPVNPSL